MRQIYKQKIQDLINIQNYMEFIYNQIELENIG